MCETFLDRVNSCRGIRRRIAVFLRFWTKSYRNGTEGIKLGCACCCEARNVVVGKRRGWKAILPLGPSLIAAIAYVDPGNFATNIQSRSQFGYKLLWVVLLANVKVMVLQNLSSKWGIATGRPA